MSQVLLLTSVMAGCRRKSRSMHQVSWNIAGWTKDNCWLNRWEKCFQGVMTSFWGFLCCFFFPSPLKTLSCGNIPNDQMEVDNNSSVSEYLLVWLLNHASIFCTSESPIFPSRASTVLQSSRQRKAVLSCIDSPLCSGSGCPEGCLTSFHF